MRRILRPRESLEDDWRYAGEEPAPHSLIVPLAQLRIEPPPHAARLGVRLAPADSVQELAPCLGRLALIALEFPSPGDGRGYSQARALREHLKFSGELRAVGAGVRQDLIFYMARCGIDAFELPEGEDEAAARRALTRYDIAYQDASAAVTLRAQRFARPSAAAS